MALPSVHLSVCLSSIRPSFYLSLRLFVRRTPYLRNCTSSDHNFWYICVKSWYLQAINEKSKFLKNNNKKKAEYIITLHLCIKNDDHMMHGSWDIKARRTDFFNRFVLLFAFLPHTSPENQNFEKKKKSLEISSFYTIVPNDNHMMYGSWNMKPNRHNFLSFWAIFCIFTLLTTQKIKMRYGTWDMTRDRLLFFIFKLLFTLLI